MFRAAPVGAVLPSIVVLVNERFVLPSRRAAPPAVPAALSAIVEFTNCTGSVLLKGWKAIAPPFRSAVLPDSVVPVMVMVPPP